MSLTLAPEAPPLTMDEHGRIRVGGTRVSLDLIVADYKSGLKAEEIAEKYDVLALADVYGAISYFLRHTPEVEAYLARREAEARAIRERIEKSQPPFPSKAELLARLAARKTASIGTETRTEVDCDVPFVTRFVE